MVASLIGELARLSYTADSFAELPRPGISHNLPFTGWCRALGVPISKKQRDFKQYRFFRACIAYRLLFAIEPRSLKAWI